MRRLIVNADDFGLTSGVNRGILEAHKQGIVTSATIMAKSHAFEEATVLARSDTALPHTFSVGCHIVLLDGEPVLSPERVPSLVQSKDHGQLRSSLGDFVVCSFRGKLNPVEVEAEATAQLAVVQEAGVQLSHFDTHKHAHMFPAVLRPLLRAARSRGVPAVRNPFGQVWPLPLSVRGRRGNDWRNLACCGPLLQTFAVKWPRRVCAPRTARLACSLPACSTWICSLPSLTASRKEHGNSWCIPVTTMPILIDSRRACGSRASRSYGC
jgi:predicted glycoside hydrolase/deacetylase ChbG (UPF0249 family)